VDYIIKLDQKPYFRTADGDYNLNKTLRERVKLYKVINKAKEEILKDKNYIIKCNEEIKKHLNITLSEDKTKVLNVAINNHSVEEYLLYFGYSILLTNTSLDKKSCYQHYSQKDIVEKSFHRFKAYLGLDRPRVHASRGMINKTFIIYLCQIIYSYIIKIMRDNDMFKTMTVQKLFYELKKIKLFFVGNKQFVKPITKEQKSILNIFDIK
jgi:hypothetical protein